MEKSLSPGKQLALRMVQFSQQHGIPVQRIIEASHINRSTFSRWRAGQTSPTVITQDRVELALKALTP